MQRAARPSGLDDSQIRKHRQPACSGSSEQTLRNYGDESEPAVAGAERPVAAGAACREAAFCRCRSAACRPPRGVRQCVLRSPLRDRMQGNRDRAKWALGRPLAYERWSAKAAGGANNPCLRGPLPRCLCCSQWGTETQLDMRQLVSCAGELLHVVFSYRPLKAQWRPPGCQARGKAKADRRPRWLPESSGTFLELSPSSSTLGRPKHGARRQKE